MLLIGCCKRKIFSFELGYGFRSPYFTANLNVYHTQWFDKTNAASVNIEDEKGNQVDRATINMQGSMPLTKELNWTLWQDLSDGWILTVCSLLKLALEQHAERIFYNSLGQPLAYENGKFVEATGIMAPDHASVALVWMVSEWEAHCENHSPHWVLRQRYQRHYA